MTKTFLWSLGFCALLPLALLFGGWGAVVLLLLFGGLPLLVFGIAFHLNRKAERPTRTPQVASPGTVFERAHSLTIQDLLRLSPAQFEEFIAIFAEAMGRDYHDARVVGGSGDVGIDVSAKNIFEMPVVFQCKRYDPTQVVDSPMIQQFLGSITFYHAIYGWFITTSSFTSAARSIAKTSGRIHLLDGPTLLAYVSTRHSEMYLIWKQKQEGWLL